MTHYVINIGSHGLWLLVNDARPNIALYMERPNLNYVWLSGFSPRLGSAVLGIEDVRKIVFPDYTEVDEEMYEELIKSLPDLPVFVLVSSSNTEPTSRTACTTTIIPVTPMEIEVENVSANSSNGTAVITQDSTQQHGPGKYKLSLNNWICLDTCCHWPLLNRGR